MSDTAHSYTWHRKSALSLSTASVYSQSPTSLHSARRQQSVAYSRRTRSWCSSVFHQFNAAHEHDSPPPPVPSLPHLVVQDMDRGVQIDNGEGSSVTPSSTPSSGRPSVLPPLPTLTPYTSLSSQLECWPSRLPSARHARPRGPRGPLLSYTQLYGDRQDTSRETAGAPGIGQQDDALVDGFPDILPPYEAGRRAA